MAEALRPRFAVHLTMQRTAPATRTTGQSISSAQAQDTRNKVGQRSSLLPQPHPPNPSPPCLEVSVSLRSFGQPGIDQTDLKLRGLFASAFHAEINTMWNPPAFLK